MGTGWVAELLWVLFWGREILGNPAVGRAGWRDRGAGGTGDTSGAGMTLYYRPFSSTVSVGGAVGGDGDFATSLVSLMGAEEPKVPVTGTAPHQGWVL